MAVKFEDLGEGGDARRGSDSREYPPLRSRPPFAASTASAAKESTIFHVTHMRNLEQIVADKQIYADTNAEWEGRPIVDISSPETRTERRNHPSAFEGHPISDFVPFSFTPNASVFDHVASSDTDASSMAVLVSTARSVRKWQKESRKEYRPRVLVYDRSPLDAGANVGQTKSELEALQRLFEKNPHGSGPELRAAEFLVLGYFPFRRVSSIAVSRAELVSVVHRILPPTFETPSVIVRPNWFNTPFKRS